MALSNDATNFVLQALKGLMATSGQCFTAFDITKAARSLTSERIDHEDVREVIHSLYDQGFMSGYQRSSHVLSVNGSRVAAQLFIPPGGSALSYDPNHVIMSKTTCDAASCGDCECDDEPDEDNIDNCDDEDTDLDDDLDSDDLDADVEEMADIIRKPGISVHRDDFANLLAKRAEDRNRQVSSPTYTAPPLVGLTGPGILPPKIMHDGPSNDRYGPAIGATCLFIPTAPVPAPVSVTPPVNLGGQVVLDGGQGGATPPSTPPPAPVPPPPTAPSKPVSPSEREAYLKKWNIGLVDGPGEPQPSLLSTLKDRVAAKLRDLLS